MENNNNESFWQFSDQLRLHGSNLANLSLNDSIWSLNNSYTKKPESRRNFDTGAASDVKHPTGNLVNNTNNNHLNHGWKFGSGQGQANMGIDLNGGFNKGVYSKHVNNHNLNHNYNHNHNQYYGNFDVVGLKGKKNIDHHEYTHNNNNNSQKAVPLSWGVGRAGYNSLTLSEAGSKMKGGKKNKEVKKENNNNNYNKESNGESIKIDKRFKSLPLSESLPRNETVGGYIFVCNNDTMEENLNRKLFGLPPRYRDSVRQITPGLPLFLYNYSNHQLHGIYEAASFGGTNIDPTAWEDKKNHGESRFPAQVRVHTRKLCEPLDEDAFRPILHHYDGPKFRLELSVPEALSLLDIFDEKKA